MATRKDLLAFWRRLPSDSFVHPDDEAALASVRHKLSTDVLPGPWWGALKTARVFVLLANPGLNKSKDPEVVSDGKMASLRRRRLAGEDVEVEILACHRTAKSRFEKEFQRRFRGACDISRLAIDLCVLNLVAYKSEVFRDGKVAGLVESSRLIRRVVHDELAPAARRGHMMLVVGRQAKHWGFSESDQSQTLRVLDPKTEARGAVLTTNTTHGCLIRDFLGSKHND